MNTKPKRKYGVIRQGAEASAGTNDDVFNKFFPGETEPVSETSLVPETSHTPETSLTQPTSLAKAPPVTSLTPEPSPVSEVSLVSETNQNLIEYAETFTFGTGHLRLNHDFLDRIITQLEGDEQLLYIHILRYREGQSDTTVYLNWPLLCRRTHKSQTRLFRAARTLEARGLVEKLGYSFGRGKTQGFRFRLFLPTSLVSQTSLPRQASLTPQTDSNRKALKETKKVTVCDRCKEPPVGLYYPSGTVGVGPVKRCTHSRHGEGK